MGTVVLARRQYLRLNATTVEGVRTIDSKSIALDGAFFLDFLMRITLGTELPSDAFVRTSGLPLAVLSGSPCVPSLADFVSALKRKDTNAIITAFTSAST